MAFSGQEFFFRFSDDRCNSARIAQKNRALFGKSDAASGAIEEADAKVVFEGLDLKSDGWLREEEQFRSFPKVEVLSNRSKDLQSKILQLCHEQIIHGIGWK